MNTDKLIVNVTEGVYHLPLQQIVRLKASSNYTEIFLSNKKKIVTAKVLKLFASQLEPMGFIRIHRAHLINKEHIRFVLPDGAIKMNDDSIAETSKRMRQHAMGAITAG